MTRVLPSYVQGSWQVGGGEHRELLDAATGEAVAAIPATVPDAAAALAYARDTGGAALRALTFAERAAILKSLARHLSGQVDEFAALSTRTGATRRDTTVDVDGGIGTLAVYASKGGRELPDLTVLPDGDTESLGRAGTFAGRHIFSPKLGAAVQINAFNFPVWGMLEKFAPAFLAGMASVVKPASQTAYLTELVVRRIIESDLLPDGALSLLCGGPAGLLESLSSQDTLSFTGSASTAYALRVHPTVAGRSVAFNAEADSLNCSILGPDVTADDPEFAGYVEALVTEMTVKAGQKCTAIRRAFVPAHLVDAVAAAVSDRLTSVVVGHPGDPETDMGPVAGLAQRDEVRAAVDRLSTVSKLVFGDPRVVPEAVAASGADPERGAFVSPILLRCEDITASAPHEVEAFGPVATLLPYRDLAELVPAVARGDGSLVGSIVTHDQAIALRLITALSPWHGRLLVLDRDDADESTGHGVALPHLLHGGPGRAGGGEELGGLRALRHYLQRTAVQGHPKLLAQLDAARNN
jgi:oxepin-CoA hydrolase / 3-oxo-5,6-dehydrosuberyl-CoA semialdehyde dehydrogenase